MSFQFIILGDIHVSSKSGKVTRATRSIIEHAAAQKPRFVVLAGDMTNGNRRDGHKIDRVRRWWSGLERALAPLREANIPVLPIAGNHDWYTEAHRQGYCEAWADLAQQVGDITLTGPAPRYYSARIDGVQLLLLQVVTQDIEREQESWLRDQLAASSAQLRLVVGHVPLRSAMGRGSLRFERDLGGILTDGGVACYFAGHEHLVWDQELQIRGKALRQVIVGTPGARYTFPLKSSLRQRFCHGKWGFMPLNSDAFAIRRGTGEQILEAAFVSVDVDGGDYQVKPWAYDHGKGIVEFLHTDIAKPVRLLTDDEIRWLQKALNHAIDAELEIDGDFGPMTKTAIREFQREHGLGVDGVPGSETMAKLRDVAGAALG